MDSRGWLAALGALAAVLLAALWLSRPGEPARGGGRVVPDLDVRAVEAILIQAHESEGVTLERVGERWEVKDRFATVPADPAVVRDLLGTLEMLAIQRRDDGSVDPSLGVTIMRGGAPAVKLFFEASGGATDRVWASRKGQPGRFLVDGYAVRALNVSAADLRETRPLRGRLQGAEAITITASDRKVELTGPPWRLAGGARVDPVEMRALEDELDRLRMTSFGKTDAGARSAQIRIDAQGSGVTLELGGACAAPGEGVAVLRSPVGAGCVEAEALEAILRRADPLGPLIDRRPIAARPEEIDALELRRGARTVAATRAEQADALRVWLEAVARAPTGEVADAAGFRPDTDVKIGVDGGGETFAVGRAASGALALRRAAEPVVLLLAPAAAELFEPAPHRFRSLDLIARDPTDLASAAREGESISRGETLEEWRAVRPAGAAVDAAAAGRLAEAVSALRAVRVVAARAEPRHRLVRRVDLTFDPPPGGTSPERHRLDVGAATDGGGCYARLDGDPVVFELPPDRCAALTAPWTTGARSPP